MKLTWKIFLSTFILVLLALSLGGTLLLSISFSRSIEGAVEQICKDNRMMMTEIVTLIGNYNKSVYRNEEDALKSILASLSDNWTENNREYRVRNELGTTLQESAGMRNLINIEHTKLDTVAYQIYKSRDRYYLQAVAKLQLKEQIISIENSNEITTIFKTRNEQQILFLEIVLIVGGLCAIVNYVFTILITKPVLELAKATKEISEGDMGIRVTVKSKDELGTLGNNFNDMADALEEKMQELKEAARRQEDFVGSFVHEIKTPLTSIIGYADLMRSKKLDEETLFEAANYIFSEGRRLEVLSLKLLELLVEGKQEPNYRMIALSIMVDEVLEVLQPVLREKSINLTLDIPRIIVKADIELMKTLNLNLLDNARKAVGNQGNITVTAFQQEETVVLIIKDNGIGIPKADLDKIAEPFYMVDKSRSRSEGGAGLGLAICTQIMKFHKGKLTFESEPGKGTRAILTWKGVVG